MGSSGVEEMVSRVNLHMEVLNAEKDLLVFYINEYTNSITTRARRCLSREDPDVRKLQNSLSLLKKVIRYYLDLRQELLDRESPESEMNDNEDIQHKLELPTNRPLEVKAVGTSAAETTVKEEDSIETSHANANVKTLSPSCPSTRKRSRKPTKSGGSLLGRVFRRFHRLASRRRKKSATLNEAFSTSICAQGSRTEKLPTQNDASTFMVSNRVTRQEQENFGADEAYMTTTAGGSTLNREIISKLVIENPSVHLPQERPSFSPQGNGNTRHRRRPLASFNVQFIGNNDLDFYSRDGQSASPQMMRNSPQCSQCSLQLSGRQTSSNNSGNSDCCGNNERRPSPKFPTKVYAFIEEDGSEVPIQEDQTTLSSLVPINPSVCSSELSRKNSSENAIPSDLVSDKRLSSGNSPTIFPSLDERNGSEILLQRDQTTPSIVISNPPQGSLKQSRMENDCHLQIGDHGSRFETRRVSLTSTVAKTEFHCRIGRFKVTPIKLSAETELIHSLQDEGKDIYQSDLHHPSMQRNITS